MKEAGKKQGKTHEEWEKSCSEKTGKMFSIKTCWVDMRHQLEKKWTNNKPVLDIS